MKLKSETESPQILYSDMISKFFLPGFLPIYAIIPEPFIQHFESKLTKIKDSIFTLDKGILSLDKEFLIKDVMAAAKIAQNNRLVYKIAEIIGQSLGQFDQKK